MTAKQIIEIDFAGTSTREEIHDRIAKAFGFPRYYGNNWDAFDECIRDLERAPRKIRIKGFRTLKKNFSREAKLLMACLRDYRQTDAAQGMEVEMA